MDAGNVGYTIGSALGMSAIFFPLTHFAMRKQFNLKPLGESWRAFGWCFAAFALLTYSGLAPDSKTPVGALLFFALPIFLCALILKFTNQVSSGVQTQTPKTADAKIAATEPVKPGWWQTKSKIYRLWLFTSVVWFVAVSLFVAIFKPYGSPMPWEAWNSFWIVSMLPTQFIWAVIYSYNRWVK